MSRRTVAVRGARIAAGVAGVTLVAGVVAAATVLPLPSVVVEPPSVLIRPQPTDQQRVCAGGIVRLGAGRGQDATAASFVGSPDVVSSTTADGTAESVALDTPDVQARGTAGAPEVLTAAGSDGGAPTLLTGSQSQTAAGEDLVGYSASACAEAGSDSWLAAGSTTVGRTSLVLLSNPSAVTATVDLTVFGGEGAISAPGAGGITVPAGTQRVIPLAGLAPNVSSPVIRVESRGGRVVASLQQSIVRGLQPGGVEITGATAGPGLTQVIPGVRVAASAGAGLEAGETPPEVTPVPPAGSAAGEPDAGEDPVAAGPDESTGSDTDTALRVFVPGDEDALLTVGVAAEDGGNGGTSFELEVSAGQVTDITFDELEEGLYTVSIESTAPVVASARSSTGGGGAGVDFSWFVAPAGALTDDTLVAIPDGPSPRLHLHNPGSAPAEVMLTPSAGDEVRVRVPAGSTTSVPVAPLTSYRLDPASPVFASVSYLGDGQSSAFPVNPGNPSASPLRIYP